jgi:hypothetical protein
VTKILFFSFTSIAVLWVTLIWFRIFVNMSYTRNGLDPETSTIFVGDSHIRTAINDGMLEKSINIGKGSETYYFSYFKLKMLLENNKKIKHVYLGFGCHSISDYYENFIYGEYSGIYAPIYFYLLPLKEELKTILWNRANLMIFIRNVIKQGTKQSFNANSYSLLGGFSNPFYEGGHIDFLVDKRLNTQYFTNGKLNPFSELNIFYLNKIITLCETRGVNLTLLNTPVHEYYYSRIPRPYIDEINRIVKTSNVNYIDLSNLKLCDSCYTPDGDHVTHIGAKTTTLKLKELM